jgi:hypothetical protein
MVDKRGFYKDGKVVLRIIGNGIVELSFPACHDIDAFCKS